MLIVCSTGFSHSTLCNICRLHDACGVLCQSQARRRTAARAALLYYLRHDRDYRSRQPIAPIFPLEEKFKIIGAQFAFGFWIACPSVWCRSVDRPALLSQASCRRLPFCQRKLDVANRSPMDCGSLDSVRIQNAHHRGDSRRMLVVDLVRGVVFDPRLVRAAREIRSVCVCFCGNSSARFGEFFTRSETAPNERFLNAMQARHCEDFRTEPWEKVKATWLWRMRARRRTIEPARTVVPAE
jgi:hypothetical protein